MAEGNYLVVGDKTTCGGLIVEGDDTFTILDIPVAREMDKVTSGQHPGIYMITGSIPGDSLNGRGYAGTLHSKSSCPCQARFIASMVNDTCEM
ncbi:PAAR domain-containing protein [Salmonella enterica subsp. enterica serovar Newport]|nr:PAAR domain-containing protein [Salmonella enterica subsp. enterica serovar Newport]